ncbi:MAG: ATP-binding cassette domain-containing protein [Treponema sp.]|jgi:simple sugar transport system ATP-binding protein|nr:ATP-binding cassette domain-containing protein [Treponema sp.]
MAAPETADAGGPARAIPGNAAGPVKAIELRGISKVYPGRKSMANDNISLDLGRGEILCIAGENGAGKTTLMKILCGLEMPSAGEIFIRGKRVIIDSPLTARRLGIGMVHQNFMLFPEYTVAENMMMGIEPRRGFFFYDRVKAEAAAAQLIRAHHFSIEAGRPVKSLSVGEMQQVEICRMLCRNADILIFDEPTSVLTERETDSFFNTLKTLAHNGKSLVLITHKLKEIKLIADRVAVLRKGKLAGVRGAPEIDEREVSRMMVGAVPPAGVSAGTGPATGAVPAAAAGGPVLAFEDLTVLRRGQERPLLEKLAFAAGSGEILGFAGVGGNGLGVLEAVLGGFIHPASGRILHRGEDISRLNIRRLRNRGLAFVPADRLNVGSALSARVDENMIIDRRGEFFRRGIFNRKRARDFSGELIRRYRIAGKGSDPAGILSGGNIQKLILAREIEQFRDYIVFSEPTRGLDVAAAAFVHGRIAALRERGAAVILISTNLDEILALADRVIVLYRGRAAGEFRISGASDTRSIKEAIGACMTGLKT